VGWTTEVSLGLFPGKGKIHVEMDSGAHAAFYLLDTGAISPAVKLTTHIISAGVKTGGAIPPVRHTS
jgi:hypothetical protein